MGISFWIQEDFTKYYKNTIKSAKDSHQRLSLKLAINTNNDEQYDIASLVTNNKDSKKTPIYWLGFIRHNLNGF